MAFIATSSSFASPCLRIRFILPFNRTIGRDWPTSFASINRKLKWKRVGWRPYSVSSRSIRPVNSDATNFKTPLSSNSLFDIGVKLMLLINDLGGPIQIEWASTEKREREKERKREREKERYRENMFVCCEREERDKGEKRERKILWVWLSTFASDCLIVDTENNIRHIFGLFGSQPQLELLGSNFQRKFRYGADGSFLHFRQQDSPFLFAQSNSQPRDLVYWVAA